MRVLVAIANHGIKNMDYLKTLLSEYRSMRLKTDIIVLSNTPKDLGTDIEVIVGCPAKDPWALPFGHKKVFLERADEYDLFIYSEDDTLIKENNINAFLEVVGVLPENEIAGFLRYEIDSTGQRYYSTVHSHFHWVPGSVRSVGEYVFARFTNDHSACFMLTQKQLKKAIASGGFLVDPHQEKYDLLVTAATDPYAQCGFTKVICISHLDDFSLHHLPNQYIGKMGLPRRDLKLQIDKLLSKGSPESFDQELLRGTTNLNQGIWSKSYYEPCREDIIQLLPPKARTALSVGCGWGATEARLLQKGMQVIAVPLDSVIGASAEARGVRTTLPNFDNSLKALKGERFDCILFSEVLQHLSNPVEILSRFVKLLAPEGLIITSVPNFNHIKVWRSLLSGKISLRQKRDFGASLIHFTTRRMLKRWLNISGIDPVKIVFGFEGSYQRIAKWPLGPVKNALASTIIIAGKRRDRPSV